MSNIPILFFPVTKTQIIYILYLLVFFAVSCKKDSNSPTPEELKRLEETKFLATIKSDAPAQYFISGEFNGTKIYCTTTNSDIFPSHDTLYNLIAQNQSLTLDGIQMMRDNKEATVKLSININQSNIFSKPLPYTLPHQNQKPGEFATIGLVNSKDYFNPPAGTSQADHHYMSSLGSVRVQVTEINDSTLTGTFSGNIFNKQFTTIPIKNGAFHIKLKSYK